MEEHKLSIKEAMERGRFEGQVLQSLQDIKTAMTEMKDKHAGYDAKLETKVEEKHLKDYVTKSEFRPVRMIVYGIVSVIGTGVLLAILGGVLK